MLTPLGWRGKLRMITQCLYFSRTWHGRDRMHVVRLPRTLMKSDCWAPGSESSVSNFRRKSEPIARQPPCEFSQKRNADVRAPGEAWRKKRRPLSLRAWCVENGHPAARGASPLCLNSPGRPLRLTCLPNGLWSESENDLENPGAVNNAKVHVKSRRGR